MKLVRQACFLSLSSSLFLALPFHSLADVSVLDSAVSPDNGHTYLLLDNSNWTDAEDQAVLLGGHLTTINDQNENDWLSNLWGADKWLWIGLNDADTEGVFEWSSGESASYRNWRSGEPNNSNAGEDYVFILAGSDPVPAGVWNDLNDISEWINPAPPLHGVVEVIPEPSTFALAISSALAIAYLRRR